MNDDEDDDEEEEGEEETAATAGFQYKQMIVPAEVTVK